MEKVTEADLFRGDPDKPCNPATYHTIAARLATLSPKITIGEHIAYKLKGGKKISSLEAYESTSDGIIFVAPEPQQLIAKLKGAKHAGEKALAEMEEDPKHYALKLSFLKTKGVGWREKIFTDEPSSLPTTGVTQPTQSDSLIRFGTVGRTTRFSKLHCAYDIKTNEFNIHIDQTAFVLALPKGFALTPDAFGHTFNDLLWKDILRNLASDWLPNGKVKGLVRAAFRRTSFVLPTTANGFAGLEKTVNDLRRPRGGVDGLSAGLRILRPRAATVDLYNSDYLNVQLTGSWIGRDRALTISLGGEW